MRHILTLLETTICVSVRSRKRALGWVTAWKFAAHFSYTTQRLAGVFITIFILMMFCRYIKQALFSVSSFSDWECVKTFSICFFLSLPINSEHQKEPAWGSWLGAASGPVCGQMTNLPAHLLKWGYPSRRLSIPASKPGQDSTSNKVQLWFHINSLGGACSSPISRLIWGW